MSLPDVLYRGRPWGLLVLLIIFALFLDLSLSSFVIGLGYYFYPLHATLSQLAVSVTSTVTLLTYGIVMLVNNCRGGREQ